MKNYINYLLLMIFAANAETLRITEGHAAEQIAIPYPECIQYWRIEAFVDDQWVGKIDVHLPFSKVQASNMRVSIDIAKQMRGCGIGTLLFARAYEYARRNKCATLILYGQERADSFAFIKKLMHRYTIALEQNKNDSSRWIANVEVKPETNS